MEPTTAPARDGSAATATPTKAESTPVAKNEESSALTATSGKLPTETPIQKEEAKPPLQKEQVDPVKQVDTTASVTVTGESLEPRAATVQPKAEMANVDTSQMDVVTAVSTNVNTMTIKMEHPATEEEDAKPSIPVATAVAVPATEVLVRPSSLIHEAVSTVPPEITPGPAPAAEHINDPEKVVEEEHVQPCSIIDRGNAETFRAASRGSNAAGARSNAARDGSKAA